MPPLRHPALLALVADLALVVVFAAIGRATHDGDVLGPFGAGLASTAWPFALALVIAWLLTGAWRRPVAALRTGVPVWAITVALGMVLRAVSGQGVAVAFVIVAAITLLVFLVGWRTAAGAIERRRARSV